MVVAKERVALHTLRCVANLLLSLAGTSAAATSDTKQLCHAPATATMRRMQTWNVTQIKIVLGPRPVRFKGLWCHGSPNFRLISTSPCWCVSYGHPEWHDSFHLSSRSFSRSLRDLNLHVITPNGIKIDFTDPVGDTRGSLSSISYSWRGLNCAENIFFPLNGSVPRRTFASFVDQGNQ